MTAEMENLCGKRDELKAKAKTLKATDLTNQDNLNALKSVLDEIGKVDAAIDALDEAEKIEAQSATVVNAENGKEKKFKNLAEQLRAIKAAATSRGRDVDPRLVKDEIKGTGTTVDADGGYAIQSDFVGNILDRAFKRSEIVSRCRAYAVSPNSNRVNYVALDDGADAEQEGVVVAGGVQAKWVKEGETVAPSKPKFREVERKLAKVMGIAYATEEALQDLPFLAQLLEDSFSDAVAGVLTDGILNGTGTDLEMSQPIGVLGSSAVVKIAPTDKEGKSLKAQDLLNMRAAIREKDWNNAAWYMHPDLAPFLPLLNDGGSNLIFMPEGGLSGAQYSTILGRPVIFDEFMNAKGKTGSILLANFDQYMLIKKGEERKDWSMHVEFLTDQQCFRIILRVNGAPMFNNTWSVRNSETKRGSFVTLDYDAE